ncbi:unnamed protein product [Phyllotreta striolata]|uniref:C2H2-type domain-containing protein n=1 Tax=Phyllotreta striolata TaxID=444603 RepID=A0A9N9XM74_PHYSR|nr:unnamed protein product [Phyllotreta striolata]
MNNMAEGQSKSVFEPLVFEDNSYSCLQPNAETKCLLCDDTFNLNLSLPMFLAHIFDVHSIVIEDVQNICNLNEYVLYWRNKFKIYPFEEIIPSLSLDLLEQKYFLMSSLLKEDRELRHKLKLEYALKIQEFERNDKNFKRECLFCRLEYEGTRQGYLEHLSSQHNLHLGNPQNLVYIEELVANIDKKLRDLKCLYCDKIFTDRNVLKEHMRKKLHKRINPENEEYDKFYIVNYLEEDKSWKTIQEEDDRYALPRGSEANADEEYSDWNEQEDQIVCLFCKAKETDINLLCLHMETNHGFDFALSTQSMDFYQKIKLINYIRKQIHENRCLFCDEAFDSLSSLEEHLSKENHIKIPDIKVFNQPEYYFPTYENDALLYLVDDLED